MPDIQSPDPGQKVARRYNIVGPPPVLFLSPELVPVTIIDDLTKEIPSVAFAIVGGRQTNVVGQLSQVALTSRASTGVLLSDIIFRFDSPEGASDYELTQAGPSLSTGTTELWQDTRRAGNPAGVVTHGTDVGATASVVARGRVEAATRVEIALPNYVLAETNRLHLLLASANLTLNFSILWSERPE